jgi:hypothetical protein
VAHGDRNDDNGSGLHEPPGNDIYRGNDVWAYEYGIVS